MFLYGHTYSGNTILVCMAFFDLMSGCPSTYSVFKDLKVKLIGFFKFMVLENMSKTLVIPHDFYYFHLEMLVPLVDYSQC